MAPTVAVIILNWNGADMLRRFLPSVIAHSAHEAEIIVADNASTDSSLEVLRTEFPDIRVLRFAENHGFAEGYNRAIFHETADYVVLLNSDVETSEGWLSPLVAYMEANPNCAACQPKLRAYNQRTHFEYAGAAGGFIDKYGYPFCRGRVLETIEQDKGQYDEIRPIFWATGAALMVRRDVYEAVGGLDSRFFAHMEEIDLCWRMQSRGFDLVCIPQSVVYHVGGATLKQSNPRKTFLNFRNNWLMLYKNLPDHILKPIFRLRYWLDNLAALKFLLTGQGSHARAVFEARKAFRQMLPYYEDVRRENLQKATTHHFSTMLPSSLLLRYFMGAKTFAALQKYFKS